jgi:hypothetical protein
MFLSALNQKISNKAIGKDTYPCNYTGLQYNKRFAQLFVDVRYDYSKKLLRSDIRYECGDAFSMSADAVILKEIW